ncbi:MAG: T9SS type A sorting domain-containing protein [Saprospiraceae bacterium]|nr:T9SS type A sorting domain-containing protein [Saprospiraceae bacterium]
MKSIYTICCLFLFAVASYAQIDCQYQNQGFEDWYDATSIYFEPGEEPNNPIFLPDNHIPLFRFITMAFAGGFFLEPGTEEYNAFWGIGFGISQSFDAFKGESALRIGGDATFSGADIYTVNSCTEKPAMVQFSYKHVGTGPDTLGFLMVIDTAVTSVPGDQADLDALPAYVFYNIVSNTNDTSYTTVTLPFTVNHPEVETDTILTFMIVNGDINYFQGGGVSYFLIDDIKLGDFSAVDEDGDGFTSDVDCDDTNLAVYPGAVEIPNNSIDEDCDGIALIIDGDGDGFNSDDDCNDSVAAINPDAIEIPNNDIDEDCDGITLVIDVDGDGFNSNDDCNDSVAAINPDAIEIPNNDIDEDCDGIALVIDTDGDGFNSDDDCNDSVAAINPDAIEVPNNDIDENCDGVALIIDVDGDGFNSDVDCDDSNAAINPDASEIANNGIDEDCDGADLISATHHPLFQSLTLAPNPFNTEFTLNFDKPLSKLILRQSNGRELSSYPVNSQSITIPTVDLAAGLYFLQVFDENGNSVVKKLIKQ